MSREPDADEHAVLAEIGARHRLWPGTAAVRTVVRGTENTTYAVGDHIVRRSVDLGAVAREVALLRALADATAVPTPVPLVHEPELGIVVYRRLPGEPLLLRRRPAGGVEAALVDVLSALRRVAPRVGLPLDHRPAAEWHQDALRSFDAVRASLPPAQAAAVSAFLGEPPPPTDTRTIPQHNDLGAEHVLVDARGDVTGIIDWSDAARAEPARDVGRILRDLGPGPAFRVAERLDGPLHTGDEARVRFHARCTWLEDVEYALEAPHARAAYLANAQRTVEHVFPGMPRPS
ncbi:aminoglycoside phosphotransferase family protein [Cellulosimicrobium terreum]|nr:aminoglycoside phosphotransferase family protein [Cellulosimicrobium terreum]